MAIEFLAVGTAAFVILFAIIQLALLWAGQGAVEAAAHFASRRFALAARSDVVRAKADALVEASRHCRNRPGGGRASAALTSLDFARHGREQASTAAGAGDAYRVRLTHWVELAVPWIDRLLFEIAPVGKARIGGRYYLALRAERWVTVD